MCGRLRRGRESEYIIIFEDDHFAAFSEAYYLGQCQSFEEGVTEEIDWARDFKLNLKYCNYPIKLADTIICARVTNG